MPTIEVIDLKDFHKKKQIRGHFSEAMIEAISKTLEVKRAGDIVSKQTRIFFFCELYSLCHVPQYPIVM